MKSKLLIRNGINRGISYTDSQGVEYNLRYIPISLINDYPNSIRLELEFQSNYNSPHSNEDAFRVIPLPKEWALDGVSVTEEMIVELTNWIKNPVLNKTMESGEEFVMAIGTIYPRPTEFSGVLPKTLFTLNNGHVFSDCQSFLHPIESFSPRLSLGLKLIFGDSCTIIPCGQVSFSW